MKKLLYVSPECFIDVDFPILKELNKYYSLHWIVIFNDPKNSKTPKFSEEDVEEYCLTNNISYTIKTRSSKLSSLKTIGFCWRLLSAINKIEPDVIYIESFVDIYFTILSYFRLNVSKCCIGIHDVLAHIDHVDKFKDFSIWLQRMFFKNFQFFSETQRDIFVSKFKGKRHFVVPLALKSINGDSQISEKKFTFPIEFLFWGNIRRNKGLDILIDAAEILYDRGHRNFNVKIIGACDHWQYYKEKIKHTEIFKTYIEFLPNGDIPNVLREAHYFVLPYKGITQSGPLMYAFYYNLPVIASNHSGFTEFITDRKTGFLFEKNNSRSLADIMEQQLNSDEELYFDLKKSINKYVRNKFDIQILTKKYIDGFSSMNIR